VEGDAAVLSNKNPMPDKSNYVNTIEIGSQKYLVGVAPIRKVSEFVCNQSKEAGRSPT